MPGELSSSSHLGFPSKMFILVLIFWFILFSKQLSPDVTQWPLLYYFISHIYLEIDMIMENSILNDFFSPYVIRLLMPDISAAQDKQDTSLAISQLWLRSQSKTHRLDIKYWYHCHTYLIQMYAVLLLILFLPSFSHWLRKTLNITAVFTASPRGHVDFPLGFLSEATERVDVRRVLDSPSEMLLLSFRRHYLLTTTHTAFTMWFTLLPASTNLNRSKVQDWFIYLFCSHDQMRQQAHLRHWRNKYWIGA